MTEVVVVGAGVVGTSIAFHLAERGVSVSVVDRAGPAAGSTARSGGIVSCSEDTAVEASLAWESLTEYFECWTDRVDGGCGFTSTGAAALAGALDSDALEVISTMHRERVGIDVELVSATQLASLEPAAYVGDVQLAALQPRSGYADPSATTVSLLRAGQRLGVELYRRRVTGLVERQGRVSGVQTDAGVIDGEAVVLAAGAWSTAIAETVGVSLPVRPSRIQVMLFERPYSIPMHLTMNDTIGDLYLRSTADRCTLAGRESPTREWLEDPDGFKTELDDDAIDDVSCRLKHRFPQLAGSTYRLGRTAILDMSPDGKPILGPVGPDGLYTAIGWSGSGFGKAPAVGAEMARWIADGSPHRQELTGYNADRFAYGRIEGEASYHTKDKRLGRA